MISMISLSNASPLILLASHLSWYFNHWRAYVFKSFENDKANISKQLLKIDSRHLLAINLY